MSCWFPLVLASCLLAQAFCVPAGNRPWRQQRSPQDSPSDNTVDTDDDNEITISQTSSTTTTTTTERSFEDDDDDDDFGESMDVAPSTGGGSNIFSLLNLAGALFPSSSGANRLFWNMIGKYILGYPQSFGNLPFLLRRKDIADNVIEIDYVKHLTPPFQRQEDKSDEDSESHEEHDDSGSHDDSKDHDDSHDDSGSHDDSENHSGSHSNENDAAEESVEEDRSDDKVSKQDSVSNEDDDDNSNDSDYDEPPGGGDGQGGGILGLLAGLSGGEDGQSDLGSLLAAVSGIVVNLSGDGIDVNALIASGLGLFVGLLSEGEENPGAVIASYLLTSLESLTGGGSKNNGAFFGNFISKLLKGTSAAPEEENDASGSSEENKMPTKDSTGFFVSLLTSLLGDMSKGSHPW